MGIAPVYLEEALDKMLKANLLVSHAKGKYQANWCIFPTEAYFKAKLTACNIFHDNGFGEKITERLLSLKDKITALDFYGNKFDYNYLMWILYVEAGDYLGVQGVNRYISKYADKFPDEAERGYRLTMQYTLAEENFDRSKYGELRAVGWSCLHQSFSAPVYGKVEFVNYFECEPFPDDSNDGIDIDDWRRGRDKWVDASNIYLLIDLAKDPHKELSAIEEEKAAEFLKNGLLKKENGGLTVQLPIFKRETYNCIIEMIKSEITDIAEEYADMAGKTIEKQLIPYVRKDLMSNFIHWDMRMFFQQLASLFYYGWDKRLAQPEDYNTSATGLFITTE